MVKISCDFFARAIYALFFKKMNMNVVKNANRQKTNERKCKYVQKNNCFSLIFQFIFNKFVKNTTNNSAFIFLLGVGDFFLGGGLLGFSIKILVIK